MFTARRSSFITIRKKTIVSILGIKNKHTKKKKEKNKKSNMTATSSSFSFFVPLLPPHFRLQQPTPFYREIMRALHCKSFAGISYFWNTSKERIFSLLARVSKFLRTHNTNKGGSARYAQSLGEKRKSD